MSEEIEIAQVNRINNFYILFKLPQTKYNNKQIKGQRKGRL